MCRRLCTAVVIASAFMVASVQAQITVVSRLENDFRAAPGESYNGVIAVRNMSDIPRLVAVYQQDAAYTTEGTTFTDPGTLFRSNAEWISFAPSTVTIAAGETALVNYAISVPDRDSLRGSYWSVLMVESEVASPSEEVDRDDGKGKVYLGVKFRYAVQVATHIEDSGRFEPGLENVNISTSGDGDRALAIDVANRGDRMAQPELWVEIYDEQGRFVGRYEGNRERLYPGSERRQHISLGALPEGAYKALLIVDAGSDDLFGAEYDLQF